MKVGVVADTHSLDLPPQMLADFAKMDLIIHAGDFCDERIFAQLQKIQQIKAVYGNMDDPVIRKLFPRREIFKIAHYRVGLFHGEGAPKNILPCVQNEFQNQSVDVVIFGHSHQPFNERIADILYFNPGSPNDEIFAPYPSYGLLEFTDNKITSQIIKVEPHG